MRLASALAAITLVACERGSAPAAPPAPPPPAAPPVPVSAETTATAEPPPPRAVLVTLDGVRWQDFLSGADGEGAASFPCVHALVRARGVALRDGAGCGIVRPAGSSNISLPAYLEIFSGRRTRCWSNDCAAATEPTIFDDLREEGVDRRELWSIASWERLARAVRQRPDSVTVLAGTSTREAPADDDELSAILGDAAASGGYPGTTARYRPDAQTVAAALHVVASPPWRLVHVGLGDADEYAHRGDRAHYLDALTVADDAICRMVDVSDDDGPTLFVLVADHGRADDFVHHGPGSPESGRSFFAAFGTHARPRGFVCGEHDVLLTDVAPLVRRWLAWNVATDGEFDALPAGAER